MDAKKFDTIKKYKWYAHLMQLPEKELMDGVSGEENQQVWLAHVQAQFLKYERAVQEIIKAEDLK